MATAGPNGSDQPEGDSVQSQLVSAESPRRLADHPLVSWLLENSSILGLSVVHWFVIRPREKSPPRQRLAAWVLAETIKSVIGGLILIEGSIFVQTFLVDYVYDHRPYFSSLARKTSRQSLWDSFKDWVRCNLPSHTLAGASVSMLAMANAAQKGGAPRPLPSGPLTFLAKLMVARLGADAAFYTVHRALHSRWLYTWHKRHHEHKAPALVSNFHFSVADLYMEGFIPLFFALILLGGSRRLIPTPFETTLVVLYLQWYEIGSHSGKNVPTVSYFPPLAPLYNKLLGNVDSRNVEFHHMHHAKLSCNYGITQWIDRALGTARMDPNDDSKKGHENESGNGQTA